MTALTGVLVAWLILKGAGGIAFGVIPAILIVLAFSAPVGLWHGFFVTKVGVPAFIITLGTWLIASGGDRQWGIRRQAIPVCRDRSRALGHR